MNVIAPSFAAKSAAADIVGFNLQGNAAGSAAGPLSFGQEFAQGAVPSESGLIATIGGVIRPVQIDAKTFYSDGSIRFAVLTLEQPALAPSQTLQAMLSTTPQSTVAAPVDLSATLIAHGIQVDLAFEGGPDNVVDVGAALGSALASGKAEIWLSGPLATEARVSIPVSGSMRLLATVTAYADGSFSTTIGFNNDIAMSASGGPVTYAATVLLDGKAALSQPTLTQAQYQDWNTTVWGGGGQAPTVNVQHDPAYLQSFGAIPNFNLANGVDPGVISAYTSLMATAGWGSPLAANNVTQEMGMTGGRADIGITTEPNAVWLMTQDPTATTFALAQAATAGAVPWNFWDTAHDTWLNSDPYANIWTDGRGGPGSYTIGLTQQVAGDTGWGPDTAHQPDLSYYAYMMTGDEKYLNQLNAQASFDVTITWPAWRGASQLVVGSDQVRSSAWNMREIDEAAWANPAGSAEGQYFQKIAATNWKWLVAQIPAWTQLQGQAYGQIEGYAWGTENSRPWMQDYFASVAAEAAKHGNADALTVLKWESNFLVGRFLNADNGFNPHDGIVYNLILGDGNGNRYQTWAAIENASVAANSSNGNGFGQSIGDYGALALEALADIISVTGSSDAIKAYNWLVTANAPYTSQAELAWSNQFNIAPVVPQGWTIASDRTIVQIPGATAPIPTSPTITPAPTPSASTGVLTLDVSEDAYAGDAQFTITVDGQQIGGVYTATASHAAGQTQAIVVPGNLAAGPHSIGVTFLNDAYGGAPTLDRNLYVDSASLDGTTINDSTMAFRYAAAQTFDLIGPSSTPTPSTPAPTPTAPSDTNPTSVLTLNVSEDAFVGDAQMSVSVDGNNAGIYTISAAHAQNAEQAIVISGIVRLDTSHNVAITFLNDAYGGSPSLDRNLYVNSMTFDGQTVAGGSTTFFYSGTETFTTVVPQNWYS